MDATDKNRAMSETVLAIDPGKSNLGVWCGTVAEIDGRLVPDTAAIDKLDIGDGAAYSGSVDVISRQPWFPNADAAKTFSAVVETQDPRNMPARVVACTLYGFLRGRGIAAEFSSSRLKNDAIDLLARQYGVALLPKPPVGEGDAKTRKRIMHSVNKKNSKAVVFKMMDALDDPEVSCRLHAATDPQGRKKADDMTDALLLGIGLWMKKTGYGKKRATKVKKPRAK